MKRNLTLTLVAFATAILFAGCLGSGEQTQRGVTFDEFGATDSSSKKEPNSISPLDVKFQGDLRDYFEIIDREYKAKKASIGNDYYYQVEVKRLQKPLPFKKGEELADWNDKEGLLLKFQPDFFDENGDLVCSGSEYSIPEDVAKLNPGETAFIEVEPYQFGKEDVLSIIKTFKLKSTMRHNVPEGKAKVSSNDVEDDEDYDKALEQAQKTMEVVGGAAKALGELSKSL